MTPEERLEKAALYLDRWANAIRSDWGSIDGRSCKWQLNSLSEYMRSDKEDYDPFATILCDIGGFIHWAGNAFDHECYE